MRRGGLAAFPTETVYGLGADAGNGRAVAAIFAVKGRPRFNPLIVHVGDRAVAERIGRLNDLAQVLARAFWPGPLTLVVPRRGGEVSDLVSAGLETIALRVPAHPVAQALLAAFGGAIAAPSANRSGRLSPTRAGHLKDLPGVFVLDGGPAALGLESTVIGCAGDAPVLLRKGALAQEEIEAVLGRALLPAPGGGRGGGAGHPSPGMSLSHYAPVKRLRLEVGDLRPGEGLLAFGPPPPGAKAARQLSRTGDLREAAANFFAMLHELDADPAIAAIAVMPIPDHGLGAAINDRLRRAASGGSDQKGRHVSRGVAQGDG